MLTSNQKAKNISLAMKNSKFADELSNALSAPVGSTKRKKALSVLNAYKKQYNGQGGVMDMINPLNQYKSSLIAGPMSAIGTIGDYAKNSFIPTAQGIGQGIKNLFGSFSDKNVTAPQSPATTPPVTQETATPSAVETPPVTTSGETISTGATIEFPSVESVGSENLVDSYLKSIGDSLPQDFDIDSWYNRLSEEEKIRLKPLYDYRKSSLPGTSETFANMILADKDKYKQMFPNTPESEIPVGASLVGQLNALESSLMEKYKLDSLSDNLQQLESRGTVLKENVNDYITGKDNYLKDIGSLINSAKEKMLKMDMANPQVSKTMTNYMNYLYTMKGSTQKRYVDYLNKAIDQHNNELQRAQDVYNAAYDKFKYEYEKKVSITTENYNTLKTLLKEMYSSLESYSTSVYDNAALKYNYLKDVADAQKSMLESQELATEVEQGGRAKEITLSRGDNRYRINPKTGQYELVLEGQGTQTEADKIRSVGEDIEDTMQESKGSDGYVDPKLFSDALSYYVQKGGSEKDFYIIFRKYINPDNAEVYVPSVEMRMITLGFEK